MKVYQKIQQLRNGSIKISIRMGRGPTQAWAEVWMEGMTDFIVVIEDNPIDITISHAGPELTMIEVVRAHAGDADDS